MNKLLDFVFKVLFEKLPILNLLDGYKTELGRALEFASAFIILLQQYSIPVPYLDTINGWILFLSGIILKTVGVAHAANKERRGL